MVVLENLRVSLTKNGYLKIAELLQQFPPADLLNHCDGRGTFIDVKANQVRNILSSQQFGGSPPPLWEQVRRHDLETIRSFVMLAVIMSHHRLIRALADSNGTIHRTELGGPHQKEYTNLAHSLDELGLCNFERGAAEVRYRMTPLTDRLRPLSLEVRQLLALKLAKCGWFDPRSHSGSADLPLAEQCIAIRLHEALQLSPPDFHRWLAGEARSIR